MSSLMLIFLTVKMLNMKTVLDIFIHVVSI